ncbi:replicative helicase loader/inhibitor [Rossellomorea sp. AcN35-11]|nr:hypothetical protein [Rossellomorea aquimaris]WJV29853.1 replicative helicase loader/inhibitor [Rossellomorea sp. AcN35-11]
MTIDEFRELLKMIQGAYPQRLLTRETANIWFQHLKNCDYHVVKRRIEAHIKESPHLPKISDLYEPPVEETAILETMEEWEKEGAIRIENERRNPWTRPAPPWAR